MNYHSIFFFCALSTQALALTIIGPSGAAVLNREVVGDSRTDTSVNIQAIEVRRATSQSSASQVVEADKILQIVIAANTVSDFLLNPEFQASPDFDALWSSSNPSIATVDEAGFVTWVSDGAVRIRLETIYGDYTAAIDVDTSLSSPTTTVIGYQSGSLGKAAWDATRALAIAGGDKNLFTTQDHAQGTYLRNTNNWTASLDWTGVSNWNSDGGSRKAGVAITPYHTAHAWHAGYTPQVGSTLRFVDQAHNIVNRTVVARTRVGLTDIGLVRLNEPLPTSIKVYSVLPSDWADYSPAQSLKGVIAVVFDQEEKTLAKQILNVSSQGFFGAISHSPTEAFATSSAVYPTLTEALITGDSGNPFFIVLTGEPILMGCVYSQKNLPFLSNHITEINSSLESLGPGASTVTTVDLSGFTDY